MHWQIEKSCFPGVKSDLSQIKAVLAWSSDMSGFVTGCYWFRWNRSSRACHKWQKLSIPRNIRITVDLLWIMLYLRGRVMVFSFVGRNFGFTWFIWWSGLMLFSGDFHLIQINYTIWYIFIFILIHWRFGAAFVLGCWFQNVILIINGCLLLVWLLKWLAVLDQSSIFIHILTYYTNSDKV